MVWTTKFLGRDRDYIVIRHKLRDTDGMICGVKFRRGYGVVEKNSRLYKQIKRLPHLKSALEFPLMHLSSLPFIVREKEIEIIYGTDVYYHYKKEKLAYDERKAIETKQKEEQEHLEGDDLCKFVRENGELCKHEAYTLSPSQHCLRHILLDEKLEEAVGFRVPKMLSKDEKKQWKDKVIKKLTKRKDKNSK